MSNPALAGNTYLAVGVLLHCVERAGADFSPFVEILRTSEAEHRDLTQEELDALVDVAVKNFGFEVEAPPPVVVDPPAPPEPPPVIPPLDPAEDSMRLAAAYFLRTGDMDPLLAVSARVVAGPKSVGGAPAEAPRLGAVLLKAAVVSAAKQTAAVAAFKSE